MKKIIDDFLDLNKPILSGNTDPTAFDEGRAAHHQYLLRAAAAIPEDICRAPAGALQISFPFYLGHSCYKNKTGGKHKTKIEGKTSSWWEDSIPPNKTKEKRESRQEIEREILNGS